MAVGLATTTLANNWINTLRGTSYNNTGGLFVRLHTADPGAAGTTAGSAGSTTRVAIAFATATGGALGAITGTLPSWTNGGTSETISHVSFWDAATGGNLLWTAALGTPRAWVSGDTFVLTTAGLSLTPLAS